MPRTCKLLLLGFLPLIVGYAMNFALYLPLPLSGFLLAALEAGLLVLWGYLAYRLSAPGKNPVWQAFLLSAVGLVMLGLILYQNLALGQYWSGFFGVATQHYFLPVLTLVSTFVTPLYRLAADVLEIWPFYIFCWIALFLAALVGCALRRRRG